MSNFNDVLPLSGIPTIPQYAKYRGAWVAPDTLEQYKNNGHPLYGPEDIVYQFNEHGFRSPSFKQKADIKLLTIGCSYVMGIGLPFEQVFHQVLATALRSQKTVVSWAMGHGGASNDWIARMTVIAVKELKPDFVIISFADQNRREFVDKEGKIYRYWPHWTRPENLYGDKSVYESLDLVVNLYDDIRNAWMNYNLISSTLKAQDIPWAWIHNGFSEEILNRVSLKRCAGAWENHKEPLARDNRHPGPQTSGNMAKKLLPFVKESLSI